MGWFELEDSTNNTGGTRRWNYNNSYKRRQGRHNWGRRASVVSNNETHRRSKNDNYVSEQAQIVYHSDLWGTSARMNWRRSGTRKNMTRNTTTTTTFKWYTLRNDWSNTRSNWFTTTNRCIYWNTNKCSITKSNYYIITKSITSINWCTNTTSYCNTNWSNSYTNK